MRPFLDGWFYMPVQRIADLDGMINTLTVKSRFKASLNGGENKPIKCFDNETHPGYIGIPPRYALDRLKKIYGDKWLDVFDDHTVLGEPWHVPKMPDLFHPNAHPEQRIIVPQIKQALIDHRASMLTADTGTGKTVMSLHIAADLGVKPIIFVNKERLMLQWVEEIKTHLGINEKDIGIVQGSRCEVDKMITIAMIQTVYKGRYKQQLRNKFGIAIYDEVHNLGAEQFSKVLGQVNTYYMLGQSATTDRIDARDKVYKFHFGTGDVTARADALPIKVNVLAYRRRVEDPNVKDNWGTNRNSKVLCVSRDGRRNWLIAGLIASLAKSGRNVLIVSEYKAQLMTLFNMAVKQGMDPTVAGHFWLGGAKLQTFAKLPSLLTEKAYHSYVMTHSQVIFATYGMMKEGISINRLDAGIDATPQSSAKQLIGRIRRPYPSKKLPVWYTLRDTDDQTLSRYCDMRIKEFEQDPTVTLVRHDRKT